MKSSVRASSRHVVLVAICGNALVALAKFAAAAFSGSAAILASAVHSVADTANQGLLLVGIRLSTKSDPRYPLGRAREVYLWSFMVSLMLFLASGVIALYEGVKKLSAHHEPHGSLVPALVVLVVSMTIEGLSLREASREFNRSRREGSFIRRVFSARDPTVPIVLLEDVAALTGLLVAFVSVITAWSTGSGVADGIGSLLIGVLLCGVGVSLAYQTHGLVIGKSAPPEMRERALGLVRATPGVEGIRQLLTLQMGPDSVLLALKIRFHRGVSVEEVERVTSGIEGRVRAAIPEMKRIFIEPDGDYDRTSDPFLVTDGEAR